jgi:hypothetical protein
MTFLSFSGLGREQTLFTKSCVLLENCALLSYYAANSGRFFTDVLGQLIGLILTAQESKKKQSLM